MTSAAKRCPFSLPPSKKWKESTWEACKSGTTTLSLPLWNQLVLKTSQMMRALVSQRQGDI
jgi:hypothetical protein